MVLSGIEPKRTEFNDGSYIVPLDELENEKVKEFVRSKKEWSHLSNPPSAAIVIPYEMHPAIAEKYGHDYVGKIAERIHKKVYDIILALTLVGPCSPWRLYSFSYISSLPVGPYFSAVGGGATYYSELTPGGPIHKGEYNPEFAKEIASRFLALPEKFRKHLRVALERLNLSLRRYLLTDKAIELGIALEAVLAKDRNAWDPLSLTIRLRGAWLVGATAEDRKTISRILNTIYGYRSKAVHTGEINGDQNEIRSNVWLGQYYCAQVIAMLILADEKIDWDGLVLGEGKAL